MAFLWPEAIVVALALPAFAAYYLRLERRRCDAARRHAALYAASAASARHAHRGARHVPLVLFLAALAALTIALMRPQARVGAFSVKGDVVLAIDVSTSMNADDVRPTRLAQAKEVAKAFVDRHADEVRIGLVSFAAQATPELDPTTDREALFAAIDRLAARQGTALGSAITAGLAMLLPEAELDASSGPSLGHVPRTAGASAAGRDAAANSKPGSRASAALVVFSDGQSSTGADVGAATRLAARHGIRVHALGVGTQDGAPMRFQGWAMRVQLDEPALAQIAAATGGAYFRASGPIDWARIMQPIRDHTPPEASYTEITALFAGIAAFAAAAAALCSLMRRQRVL